MQQADARKEAASRDRLFRARLFSVLQGTIDSLIWFVVVVLAVVLRYEFNTDGINWWATVAIALIAAILQPIIGLFSGLYIGRFAYGSFDEVRALTVASFINMLTLTVVVVFAARIYDVPRGTAVLAFPMGLVFTFGARYLRRLTYEHSQRPQLNAAPALVVGAGHVGEIIVRTIMRDSKSPIRVAAIIDDDPSKKRLRLHGVPVLGKLDDIVEIAQRTNAEVLVIAIANVPSTQMRRIHDLARAAGLRVLIAPTVERLVAGPIAVADLRSINIEDLIGRHAIDTEIETIAGYVTGKRVLVTGAGGSIGSELCRQLHKFGPKELIMLDRDETGLQHAQLGTFGHGLLDTKDVVLADIREGDEIMQIFEDRRPEVVFHAAALKHLPMLEQYPREAWKTNVLGTLNVVQAARAVGVTTFVNISTDKAANPSSALGHSKRVAEKIASWGAEDTGLTYLSVRFGNVIGSRGSMLPTFQSLIESGGPITVTHPDITRFFMTIPEACQLVIQAGGIGRPGEVLILDMGEPVKILDIAERMIEMSGKQIEIVFTGLREGEKMHEELVGDSEELDRPFHPQISHASVDWISPDLLDYDTWLQRMHVDEQKLPRVSSERVSKE